MLRRTAALAAAAALVLAGCTAEDDPNVPGEDELLESPTPPEVPEEAVPGTDPTAGPGERPSPGECTALPTNQDGDYAVADAGTARVRYDVDTLVVEEVEPAEGWEHEVTTESDDEVEITFSGETELVLRVELAEGGLIEVEVCARE